MVVWGGSLRRRSGRWISMAIQSKKSSTANTGEPIPDTMRAAAIDRYGGPEVLSLHKPKCRLSITARC